MKIMLWLQIEENGLRKLVNVPSANFKKSDFDERIFPVLTCMSAYSKCLVSTQVRVTALANRNSLVIYVFCPSKLPFPSNFLLSMDNDLEQTSITTPYEIFMISLTDKRFSGLF